MGTQGHLEHIEVTVTSRPYILYETVALLRAYVNGSDISGLTGDGAYCLHPSEVEEIAEQVCAGIDIAAPWVQLFFKNYPILNDVKSSTCLASCIAYSFFFIETEETTLRQQLDYVSEKWAVTRREGYQINSINRFSIEIEPAVTAEPIRLFEELQGLPISSEFSMLLYEAFSDLDFFIDQLYALIAPVAELLAQALRPYEARTAELAGQWTDFLKERSVLNDFLRRGTGTEISETLEEIKIVLRYFEPRMVVGSYVADKCIADLHVGIGVKPVLSASGKEEKIDLEREFAAFKLLGDKSRRDIIRLLGKNALSMQEIINQLGINSGTVFRNINSLFQAGLLSREIHGDRFFYKAKLDDIQTIFDHMMRYFRESVFPE